MAADSIKGDLSLLAGRELHMAADKNPGSTNSQILLILNDETPL